MKVLVSGGNSMIGRATIEKLKEKNYDVVGVSRQDCDFLQLDQVRSLFVAHKPDIYISLVGTNGGISYNKNYPFDIYAQTTLTGMNGVLACIENGVKKILYIVPSCALNPSEYTSIEQDLYYGRPHQSVECHGLAKRSVVDCINFAVRQYGNSGLWANIIIGQNSFGPYDRFDDERGKVVSGLIRRIVQAKINREDSVVIWGTGKPLREFLYCKDFAAGIVSTLESENVKRDIIITSGYEISIKELAEKIKLFSGYEGELVFDTTKQDGQMRKRLSREMMDNCLDFTITDFDVALKETIDWYISTLEKK
jgi:nucleoside-diphosphate-sugar epimerase